MQEWLSKSGQPNAPGTNLPPSQSQQQFMAAQQAQAMAEGHSSAKNKFI